VAAIYAKTASFDLDISLYKAADVLPTLSGKTLVPSTAGVSGGQNYRSLSWTATDGGTYYVNVFGLSSTAAGKYVLVTR
jgi:hypothetical protein